MGVIITGTPPGGKRVKLIDELPLSTPYVVQVWPIYACNLNCKYCHFAIPIKNREHMVEEPIMDEKLFDIWMDECRMFPKLIKVVRFVGMGEPLLHPYIAEMVNSVSQYEIAERVELLTNGLALTPNVTDDLVRAGLNRLVVSVQGYREKDYVLASGRKFDFEEYISNLEYAKANKKEMHIHIKGIDVNIPDADYFYETFLPVCDTVGIEKAGPIYRGVPFNKTLRGDTEGTQYGTPRQEVRICPQPFTSMQIHPDGKVIPCYAIENKEYIGDLNEDRLYDIWHGEKMREFQRTMISGRMAYEDCVNCQIIDHRAYEEDCLDDYAPTLRELYDNL